MFCLPKTAWPSDFAITAHCGNWELMPLAIGAQITPVAIIARNMKKDYFNRALEKIRLRHGNRIIYRDSGVKVMFSFLKSNGIMGMLPESRIVAMSFCEPRSW